MLALLRRLRASRGLTAPARHAIQLEAVQALACWPLQPCAHGEEGGAATLRILPLALEPLLHRPAEAPNGGPFPQHHTPRAHGDAALAAPAAAAAGEKETEAEAAETAEAECVRH